MAKNTNLKPVATETAIPTHILDVLANQPAGDFIPLCFWFPRYGTSKVAGKALAIDNSRMPAVALAEYFRYGQQRKHNDGKSGTDEEKQAEAQEQIDSFYAGELTVRRGDETTTVRRMVAAIAYKAKAPADAVKAFRKLAVKEQNDFLDALWAKNEAKLAPAFEKEMARREAARKEAAAMAAEVADDLDL